MAEAAAPPTPQTPALPRSRISPARAAVVTADRRLRRILYLALAVVALAFLVHGWHALRLQDPAAAERAITDRAAGHAALLQEVGRLTLAIAIDPAERRGHA
ncbi:MAG TPA: hypothetical protein VLM87_00655, partial [Rubrivivax sp.]|nr:hypothetical protein [Rubrivivax sp.]